jgi:acyl-[acyl carrier protein]--UDP-N-acetylglucosamine O-acyltransferase
MILPNVTINHDVIVDDYVLIASGVNIAGYTHVHESSYIGSGSVIQCRLQIGPRALVGMGSNVLQDVPPEVVVAGNPARILRPLDPSN